MIAMFDLGTFTARSDHESGCDDLPWAMAQQTRWGESNIMETMYEGIYYGWPDEAYNFVYVGDTQESHSLVMKLKFHTN
jgi:hypothetical protein